MFAKQVGFVAVLLVLTIGLGINSAYLAYDNSAYQATAQTIASREDPDRLGHWRQAEIYLASFVQTNWYRTFSHLKFPRSTANQLLQTCREQIELTSKIDEELKGLEDRSRTAPSLPTLVAIISESEKVQIGPDYPFLGNRRYRSRPKIQGQSVFQSV